MADDNVTDLPVKEQQGQTPESIEKQILTEMTKAKNTRFKSKLSELMNKRSELTKSINLIDEQISSLKEDYAKDLI